jgi:polysaccharide export outer membrane protein
LVDDIMAAGRTPMELKNIITKNLVQFVENPHVYVTVKEPNSQYLCVLGNVKSPGRYQMLTPTSVLQALAMAGGFNEWADKDDTIVLRGQGEDQKVLRFSYSDVVSGEETRHNFRVRPGDVIVVP